MQSLFKSNMIKAEIQDAVLTEMKESRNSEEKYAHDQGFYPSLALLHHYKVECKYKPNQHTLSHQESCPLQHQK